MGIGLEGSEESWLTAAQGMITKLNGEGYAIAKWDITLPQIKPFPYDWDREDPDAS